MDGRVTRPVDDRPTGSAEAEGFVAMPTLEGFEVLRLLRRTESKDVFLCRQDSPVLEVAVEIDRAASVGDSKLRGTGLAKSGSGPVKKRWGGAKGKFLDAGTTGDGRVFVVRTLSEQEARSIHGDGGVVDDELGTSGPGGPRKIVKLIDGETGAIQHSDEFQLPPVGSMATDDATDDPDFEEAPRPLDGETDEELPYGIEDEEIRAEDADEVEDADDEMAEIARILRRWIRIMAVITLLVAIGVIVTLASSP